MEPKVLRHNVCLSFDFDTQSGFIARGMTTPTSHPRGEFGPIGASRILALMKACWTEKEIDFDGSHWKLEHASMEPKPVQKPHPPVWFGGNHPNALKRAARVGDGFFGAGSQTTAAFTEQVQAIKRQLSEQGRDPARFQIAKRVYVHVDDGQALARERIAAAHARHYGGRELENVAVAGPPETCVQGLRKVIEAGAELILLNSLVDDTQQMERLAAEVVPHLQEG